MPKKDVLCPICVVILSIIIYKCGIGHMTYTLGDKYNSSVQSAPEKIHGRWVQMHCLTNTPVRYINLLTEASYNPSGELRHA